MVVFACDVDIVDKVARMGVVVWSKLGLESEFRVIVAPVGFRVRSCQNYYTNIQIQMFSTC